MVGWRGWDVESPHVLADSFGANKNRCRVSEEMARREWEREVSGAVQNGTGKGRRGK